MATQTEPLLEPPGIEDGAAVWRIARDSRTLDLNSPYSYLLLFRDFAATSVVARGGDGTPIGFTTGYLRPDRPDTVVVWQIAVEGDHRGRGLAAAMLDHLVRRLRARGVGHLEATVTPGNTASDRLFTLFARRHGAALEREVLFDGALFPEEGHEPEVLYRVGPLR
ncbi:diaminobutyrate acetyltransferase [Streptomyces sp. TRM43335]|uniref:L-2,4-diaminobutyric acid acetyltransferase n=1 Tax=Streptomyces taklimakanensis TaxID=2569853 RepID=A0A6G2BHU2_9ACTN|nr:diaminobutyrate acetyltransferase [Streptomyces taklimakanensis]MTE21845.1 diaminobutyrate acetyltransferase [Streptomyces taklimakanensis]